MAEKSRRLFRVAVAVAAVVLLAWLLYRIGWKGIADSFIRIGLAGALLLLGLGVIENLLDALALRAAAGPKISAAKALSYSSAGAIVNVAIPWEAGEVLKISLLRRHMGTQDALSATLLWNYIAKSSRPAAALLAALVGLVFGYGSIRPDLAWLITVATLLSFLPYLGIKILIRLGMAGMAVRILKLLRLMGKDPDRLLAMARSFDRQIQGFWKERPGDYLRLYLFQFGARVTAWISWYAVLKLLDLPYSFGMCAMISAGMSVATYVTMIIPARIGVSEGTAYLLFSLLGLDPGVGLIGSVIMRLKMLLTTSVPALSTLGSLWKRP